jgi:hypothetical protein
VSATTITGTLQRSKTRRRANNWVDDFALLLAEQAGLVEPRYYKERVYVVSDAMNTNGQEDILRLPNPKAVDGIAHGARVRFTANVRRWDNGNGHSLGGDCSRVRNVEVLDALAVTP